ncbi:MAG: lycopene cyclase domain-containing protein [Ignavibacteria bacterium]|nr:lycopene cyclase domain-containing protein [Ignavibacteria bacterium]
MKTEYLLVLAAMLSVPLSVSFHRKLRLYRNWRALVGSIACSTMLFGIWDIIAAKRGHWWFNEEYVLGPTLAGLPVEEWLFFIVLGFVTVFTFEAVNRLSRRT